jgi:hypothetical protein
MRCFGSGHVALVHVFWSPSRCLEAMSTLTAWKLPRTRWALMVGASTPADHDSGPITATN